MRRMLTADTNLVEVKSAVQYTKPDPRKYLFEVNNVEETLVQVSESAMREAVGQASLDKALAFDPSITDRAKKLLQKTLDNYDMGVNIISVKLGDVIVPEPVQDAQRDAIKADKDRQRYQQDAETYRNDVVPRARGQAAKNLLDAEAYRLQVLALAQGETSRFDQVLEPVRACAGRYPRAHVSRDHGKCLQEFAQGHRRYQGRQQHDVPAPGEVDLLRAAVDLQSERHA